MIHNSQYYEFVRNIFGDVIALYNGSTCVAKYSYDAWGNCKVYNNSGAEITSATHVGNVNPFRYRGYYYDTESGMYYLLSRYYDPEIGQFISPDTFDYLAPETIGGVNLYAYCYNNPILYVDNCGFTPEVNIGIKPYYLYSYEGYSWHSDNYFILHNTQLHSPNIIDGVALKREETLLSWDASNFTIISVGIDVFEGHYHKNQDGYLGVKIGSFNLDFIDVSFEDELEIAILDAQVTAVTLGAYSDYMDAEALFGSIGGTLKWDDGKLTIGASLGIGFRLTFKFW